MQTIRAIKIDAEKGQVYEIRLPNHLDGIHAAVNCSLFAEVQLGERHCVLVDDEGAINGTDALFSIDTGTLLFGNGVIVSLDFNKTTYSDCKLNLTYIEKRVRFYKAVPVV